MKTNPNSCLLYLSKGDFFNTSSLFFMLMYSRSLITIPSSHNRIVGSNNDSQDTLLPPYNL